MSTSADQSQIIMLRFGGRRDKLDLLLVPATMTAVGGFNQIKLPPSPALSNATKITPPGNPRLGASSLH
jgi:hypothetical protein